MKVEQKIINKLEEEGPLNHDELADEIGLEWDELQEQIRKLRTDGIITITIDRKYELEE